jgi:hypothetical protein
MGEIPAAASSDISAPLVAAEIPAYSVITDHGKGLQFPTILCNTCHDVYDSGDALFHERYVIQPETSDRYFLSNPQCQSCHDVSDDVDRAIGEGVLWDAGVLNPRDGPQYAVPSTWKSHIQPGTGNRNRVTVTSLTSFQDSLGMGGDAILQYLGLTYQTRVGGGTATVRAGGTSVITDSEMPIGVPQELMLGYRNRYMAASGGYGPYLVPGAALIQGLGAQARVMPRPQFNLGGVLLNYVNDEGSQFLMGADANIRRDGMMGGVGVVGNTDPRSNPLLSAYLSVPDIEVANGLLSLTTRNDALISNQYDEKTGMQLTRSDNFFRWMRLDESLGVSAVYKATFPGFEETYSDLADEDVNADLFEYLPQRSDFYAVSTDLKFFDRLELNATAMNGTYYVMPGGRVALDMGFGMSNHAGVSAEKANYNVGEGVETYTLTGDIGRSYGKLAYDLAAQHYSRQGSLVGNADQDIESTTFRIRGSYTEGRVRISYDILMEALDHGEFVIKPISGRLGFQIVLGKEGQAPPQMPLEQQVRVGAKAFELVLNRSKLDYILNPDVYPHQSIQPGDPAECVMDHKKHYEAFSQVYAESDSEYEGYVCVSCHSPGETDDTTGEYVARDLNEDGNFDFPDRDEVCNKCHMEPESEDAYTGFRTDVCYDEEQIIKPRGNFTFTHFPHLQGGYSDENCLTCHDDIDQAVLGTRDHIMSMGDPSKHEEGCLDCHELEGSLNAGLMSAYNLASECQICHFYNEADGTLTGLKPMSHDDHSWLTTGGHSYVGVNPGQAPENQCAECHGEQSCLNCHGTTDNGSMILRSGFFHDNAWRNDHSSRVLAQNDWSCNHCHTASLQTTFQGQVATMYSPDLSGLLTSNVSSEVGGCRSCHLKENVLTTFTHGDGWRSDTSSIGNMLNGHALTVVGAEGMAGTNDELCLSCHAESESEPYYQLLGLLFSDPSTPEEVPIPACGSCHEAEGFGF